MNNSTIPHVDAHPVESDIRTDASIILLVLMALVVAGVGVALFGLVALGLIGVVATPVVFVLLMAVMRSRRTRLRWIIICRGRRCCARVYPMRPGI